MRRRPSGRSLSTCTRRMRPPSSIKSRSCTMGCTQSPSRRRASSTPTLKQKRQVERGGRVDQRCGPCDQVGPALLEESQGPPVIGRRLNEGIGKMKSLLLASRLTSERRGALIRSFNMLDFSSKHGRAVPNATIKDGCFRPRQHAWFLSTWARHAKRHAKLMQVRS